jgi:hypothetical protein
VAAHRHHGVVPVCRVLQVAPSAVRSAMSRPVCSRRQTDDAVEPVLLEVFNANYRVYGRRKTKVNVTWSIGRGRVDWGRCGIRGR